MDTFLEKYSLPKLTEEAAESGNRPVTADEIETVIRRLPAHKSPGPDGYTGEFYKTFKEELTPILHRLVQEIQEDRILPNSFYDASITLIPKPDRDTTKKENYRQDSLMHVDAKILNSVLGNHTSNILKRSYTIVK